MRVFLILCVVGFSGLSLSQNSTQVKTPVYCHVRDAVSPYTQKYIPAAWAAWIIGVSGVLPFVSELVLGILAYKLRASPSGASSARQSGGNDVIRLPVDDGNAPVTLPLEAIVPFGMVALTAVQATLKSLRSPSMIAAASTADISSQSAAARGDSSQPFVTKMMVIFSVVALMTHVAMDGLCNYESQ